MPSFAICEFGHHYDPLLQPEDAKPSCPTCRAVKTATPGTFLTESVAQASVIHAFVTCNLCNGRGCDKCNGSGYILKESNG